MDINKYAARKTARHFNTDERLVEKILNNIFYVTKKAIIEGDMKTVLIRGLCKFHVKDFTRKLVDEGMKTGVFTLKDGKIVRLKGKKAKKGYV